MTFNPYTKSAGALTVLADADEPLTASDVVDRMDTDADPHALMRKLTQDGHVERHGEGGKGDPYRYDITTKGLSAIDYGDDGPTDLDDVFDAEDADFEYVDLRNDATPDDVKEGTRYRAFVNNVKEYGVFVSLNRADPDVSGLVRDAAIPGDVDPLDFTHGDKVGVMLIEENDRGLAFEMVAAFDTVRGFEFERHPIAAPDPTDYEPMEDTEPEPTDDVPTDEDDRPSPWEFEGEEIEALTERTDQLEDKIDDLYAIVDERVSSIEDAVARLVVEIPSFGQLTDDDVVEAVLLVANSGYGTNTKKRRIVRAILGVHDDESEYARRERMAEDQDAAEPDNAEA